MAIDTGRTTEFGEVSRLKGVVFEYASLAASLAGIVALAILLVYVTIDAFGLESADSEWFLVYLVTLVLPTLAFAGYGVRHRDVGRVSGAVMLRLFGGVAGGLAVVILFVIFDVQLWFLVYTLGAFPAALVLLYGRRTDWPQANLIAAPTFLLGGAVAAFLKGPIGTYPVTWVVYLWSLGVPVAAYFGGRTVERTDRERGLAVGAAVLLTAVAAAFVAPAAFGVASEVGTLFALTLAVPTGMYVYRTLRARDEGAAGLLMPVVVVAGALLGAFIVGEVTVAQPESWLDWAFLTSPPSQLNAADAGLYPAIVGSVFVITNVAMLTLALGVGTAIYLEEYAPSSGAIGALTRTIQVNIANLAGVPSVVYGLLGLGLFINLLGFGIGIVLVASVTLALLILPIVIISAQEAIRSVPDELRQASYGMGATRWQTVRNVVLPRALPGVLTGTILALGRAIGETAPLLMIGAATTTFSTPTGYFDSVSAMPQQIFAWASQPNPDFRYGVVAAGVVTLLAVLLTMNSIAILVRNKYEKDA